MAQCVNPSPIRTHASASSSNAGAKSGVHMPPSLHRNAAIDGATMVALSSAFRPRSTPIQSDASVSG